MVFKKWNVQKKFSTPLCVAIISQDILKNFLGVLLNNTGLLIAYCGYDSFRSNQQ